MSESISSLISKIKNHDELSDSEYQELKQYIEGNPSQEHVKEVLLNAEDYVLRLLALKQIQSEGNQDLILRVVLNDESPPVRLAALRLLKTEESFKRVVKETSDLKVMQDALLQIHDDAFLAEYALNHNDFVIRRSALYNMNSPEFKDVYEKIALEDNTEAVQLMGIMKLDPNASADVLLRIALDENESFYIRAAAVTKLKDPKKLMQIVIASKDKTIIKLALNEISDYKVLSKLRVLVPFEIKYLISRRMKELLMI